MLTYDQIIEKIDQLEEVHLLLAAIELKVYTHLGKKHLTAGELARKIKSNSEATQVLLNGLAALGALRLVKGKFANTSETFKHFCESSPDYKKGMVHLRGGNRGEWERLVDVVRQGRGVPSSPQEDDSEGRHLFSHAMHERSEGLAQKIARQAALQPVGRLLDLGGGPGSYSAAILKKDKKATAVLLDRSSAVSVAKEITGKMKLKSRFDFIEGDMFETPFGENYQTVLYSNILHIYNVAQNRTLFKKIHRSLAVGGRLIIVDFLLKESRTEPLPAAMFALTMLLYTDTGKVYTQVEILELLKSSGFSKIQKFPIVDGAWVIEAFKK